MEIETIILRSDGQPAEKSNAGELLERTVSRELEDRDYVPVIVKRSDVGTRHPDDILEFAIEEGREQLERLLLPLMLSSVAAGLILGFTAMAVAVVTTFTQHFDIPLLTRVLTAMVYPFGFIVCILGGAQLFTEHTATAVFPVLDSKATLSQLIRLWTVVAVGNIVGAIISSKLIFLAEPVISAKLGYLEIARHLIGFSGSTLFVSALLAGWLMALGAWLILATPETFSQMLSIYVVTFLIGLGGLHHSIAGSVEIFTAYWLSSEILPSQMIKFIGTALFGNLVGGSCFVALLNYAHIRETQRKKSLVRR